jgi:hypothetical protein
MPDRADILWFKDRFGAAIQAQVEGTPLTLDLLTAIACQETGYLWARLRRKGLDEGRIAALCVGDTLDEDKGRKAFPRTRAELEAWPRGPQMFAIARQALLDMARHIPEYAAAAKRAGKFCHGFGVFQRDLQFFKQDPDYFLSRRWEAFGHSLAHAVRELQAALVRLGLAARESLTDHELAAVAIVYNTGGYKPAKGLKQGYFDGQRYYGEAIVDYLRLAHTVAAPEGAPAMPPPAAGQALMAPPRPATATGPAMQVDTRESMLRLRSEPRVSTPAQANVVGHLPDGQVVRTVTGQAVKGFYEVEAMLSGGLLRGFASAKYLRLVAADQALVAPAAAPPTAGIVAVTMPRKPGTVTRRRDLANAHSLNEPGQPGRRGTTPQALREELAAITDWLAVDDPAHRRYQPRDGLTFCNLYAHDYCHLAGVYLPRVWWSSQALLELAAGQAVDPLIGNTLFEMRANDLFRWLRDFGPGFGWRRAGTPTELQAEVDQGGIGLVVARRKEDGRSGHIVVVVPQAGAHAARRDASGQVIAPLQSQAGATNFRRGTGKLNWWNGEQFAESAFWLHA